MRRRARMVAASPHRSTFRFPLVARLALLCTSVLACSGGAEDTSPAPAGAPAADAPAPTDGAPSGAGARGGARELVVGADEAHDEAEFGALSVVLSFEGTPPEPFLLGAASSPECKHHPEVDQRSNLVLVQDGKLANVFVTLKSGVDPARVPPVPETPVELDQRGCMYLPRVVGVRVGQKLQVLNSDPTAHNVNVQAKRNTGSNRSMGANQKPLEFVFKERELGIRAKCDIHPWMGAEIHVEEHPWFGISDSGGVVHLRGIPPGDYTVEARHEVYGTQSAKVTIQAGRARRLTGTFRAK